jgi:hypothetical protein
MMKRPETFRSDFRRTSGPIPPGSPSVIPIRGEAGKTLSFLVVLSIVERIFVNVFDAFFVDQKVRCIIAVNLNAIPVIPFNDAVNFFTICQEDHHRSLVIHLPNEIVILSICLIRRSWFFSPFWFRRILFLDLIQVRSNQFSIQDFYILLRATVSLNLTSVLESARESE